MRRAAEPERDQHQAAGGDGRDKHYGRRGKEGGESGEGDDSKARRSTASRSGTYADAYRAHQRSQRRAASTMLVEWEEAARDLQEANRILAFWRDLAPPRIRRRLRQPDARPCYFNTGVMVRYTVKLEYWMEVQKQEARIYELGSLPPFLLVFAGEVKVVGHRWN
jgi:hypothetical protein